MKGGEILVGLLMYLCTLSDNSRLVDMSMVPWPVRCDCSRLIDIAMASGSVSSYSS